MITGERSSLPTGPILKYIIFKMVGTSQVAVEYPRGQSLTVVDKCLDKDILSIPEIILNIRVCLARVPYERDGYQQGGMDT